MCFIIDRGDEQKRERETKKSHDPCLAKAKNDGIVRSESRNLTPQPRPCCDTKSLDYNIGFELWDERSLATLAVTCRIRFMFMLPT